MTTNQHLHPLEISHEANTNDQLSWSQDPLVTSCQRVPAYPVGLVSVSMHEVRPNYHTYLPTYLPLSEARWDAKNGSRRSLQTSTPSQRRCSRVLEVAARQMASTTILHRLRAPGVVPIVGQRKPTEQDSNPSHRAQRRQSRRTGFIDHILGWAVVMMSMNTLPVWSAPICASKIEVRRRNPQRLGKTC